MHPITKKWWQSLWDSIRGVPQPLFYIRWSGPVTGRHNPYERHCVPCPICEGKTEYATEGLPFWKARRLQRKLTGPWDETALVRIKTDNEKPTSDK